jgi:hypothetical protein
MRLPSLNSSNRCCRFMSSCRFAWIVMASKVIYLKLKRADGRHGTKIPHYTTSSHLILTHLFSHLSYNILSFTVSPRSCGCFVLCGYGVLTIEYYSCDRLGFQGEHPVWEQASKGETSGNLHIIAMQINHRRSSQPPASSGVQPAVDPLPAPMPPALRSPPPSATTRAHRLPLWRTTVS